MMRPRLQCPLLMTVMLGVGLPLMLLSLILPSQAQSDNPVVSFIRENPDHVAVYCSVEGQPETNFQHNAEEPFKLASAFKLLVLSEFGRQIDAGLVDPDQRVPLDDVEAYHLPGTDGGAQAAWRATLPDNAQDVALRDVAYGMIAFSSNANTDYLLDTILGDDGFADLYDLLGLEQIPQINGTILGLFLARNNHETGAIDLETATTETVTVEGERLQTLYRTDPDWREAQQTYLEQRASNPLTGLMDVNSQGAYFARFGPQASAADMLHVIRAAYEGDVFSNETQSLLQEILNWPMVVNPANRDVYAALGTKGGSLAGILTNVWYVQPIDGPVIELAVFYRDVPLLQWVNWLESGAHQQLELRIVASGEGCGVLADLLAG